VQSAADLMQGCCMMQMRYGGGGKCIGDCDNRRKATTALRCGEWVFQLLLLLPLQLLLYCCCVSDLAGICCLRHDVRAQTVSPAVRRAK
jgi:hypothetical protein